MNKDSKIYLDKANKKKINKPPDGLREFQRGRYCSLLKPKIPKHRGPNERNEKKSLITIIFRPS